MSKESYLPGKSNLGNRIAIAFLSAMCTRPFGFFRKNWQPYCFEYDQSKNIHAANVRSLARVKRLLSLENLLGQTWKCTTSCSSAYQSIESVLCKPFRLTNIIITTWNVVKRATRAIFRTRIVRNVRVALYSGPVSICVESLFEWEKIVVVPRK